MILIEMCRGAIGGRHRQKKTSFLAKVHILVTIIFRKFLYFFLRFGPFLKLQKMLKNAFISGKLGNTIKMNRSEIVRHKISYQVSLLKFGIRNMITELWTWVQGGGGGG